MIFSQWRRHAITDPVRRMSSESTVLSIKLKNVDSDDKEMLSTLTLGTLRIIVSDGNLCGLETREGPWRGPGGGPDPLFGPKRGGPGGSPGGS